MADISKITGIDGVTYDIKDATARQVMTGATSSTAGTSGQVPAPSSGSQNKLLYGDGTWRNTIDIGRKANTTVGSKSTAEGTSNTASGGYSHAEGYSTTASGTYSHAEGNTTTASGDNSHAEGYSTTASGTYSHAEGNTTTASARYSHAEGYNTTAQGQSQHVFGEYNALDTTGTHLTRGDYVEIVGNGTSTSSRSNARTLDWSGNEYVAGNITTGGTINGYTLSNACARSVDLSISDGSSSPNLPTSAAVAMHVEQQEENVQKGLAILADGDIHSAIASGQYVYVKNHNILSDGLYIATAAIAANGELSTTNLTADSSGGLNSLKSDVSSLSENTIKTEETAILVDGDTSEERIAKNAYVIVRNSTITDRPDGFYKSGSTINAGTAIIASQISARTIGSEMKAISDAVQTASSQIETVQSSIAIVAEGDTHAAIGSGQYVYVKNHSTLSDGLYTASTEIAANDTLSTSNLTADSSGGLNSLKNKIPNVVNNLTTSTTGSALDASCGKAINDMLSTARVSNTSSGFTSTWAFGHVVTGVGILVPVVSGKTISITSATILNDSGVYKNLSGISISNYQFQRCIKFDIPSNAGLTGGKTYLVTLTGKVT